MQIISENQHITTHRCVY